ncbi:MAG: hypothetical protein JY451_10620 [Erythrobacter sp.]|nr:MAG: hypothetical protein JY451_10620 [Erythrobacter sp.]
MSDGFTAKILCERHNNGLSPLDAYFEKIDSVLVEIGNCLLNGNLTEDRIYFIDGFLFESAILKSSMSFMFSKILKEDIDINTVGRKRLSDWLLGWEEPAKECGLSFGMAQAQYKDGAFSYFNTLRDKSKVIGAHFGFRNLYCLIRLFRGNVSAFNGLHAKLIEFKANSGSSCYVFFGWDEPIRAKDQIGRYSGWSDHLWSEKVGSPPWSS